jgi:hypothetical protein
VLYSFSIYLDEVPQNFILNYLRESVKLLRRICAEACFVARKGSAAVVVNIFHFGFGLDIKTFYCMKTPPQNIPTAKS